MTVATLQNNAPAVQIAAAGRAKPLIIRNYGANFVYGASNSESEAIDDSVILLSFQSFNDVAHAEIALLVGESVVLDPDVNVWALAISPYNNPAAPQPNVAAQIYFGMFETDGPGFTGTDTQSLQKIANDTTGIGSLLSAFEPSTNGTGGETRIVGASTTQTFASATAADIIWQTIAYDAPNRAQGVQHPSTFNLAASTYRIRCQSAWVANTTGRRILIGQINVGGAGYVDFETAELENQPGVTGAAQMVTIDTHISINSASVLKFQGYQNSGANLQMYQGIASLCFLSIIPVAAAF